MFESLDASIAALLGDDDAIPAALQTLREAAVSFETPDDGFKSKVDRPTVNLFLNETRENRELRDTVPFIERRNGLSLRRAPLLRVDCFYMVTAWSEKQGPIMVDEEHRLLAQALKWLSRFRTIPEKYLSIGALTDQVFAPPAMVAQLDGLKNASDFWVSLGISPRPFFSLTVTIAIDLEQSLEEFPVTTVITDQHAGDPAHGNRRAVIAGTVRDRDAAVVRDAWVRLEPAGFTTVTDAAGHFVFDNVAPGTGMTLRARAPGFTEATLPNAQVPSLDIPSINGRYDLTFS